MLSRSRLALRHPAPIPHAPSHASSGCGGRAEPKWNSIGAVGGPSSGIDFSSDLPKLGAPQTPHISGIGVLNVGRSHSEAAASASFTRPVRSGKSVKSLNLRLK